VVCLSHTAKNVKNREKRSKIFDFSPEAETGKEVLGKAWGWQVCSLGKAQAMQAKSLGNSPSFRRYEPSKSAFFPLKKRS
jgi:hypothetical protein